jgi:hypothetical protein
LCSFGEAEFRMLMPMHAMMDEQYSEALAKKTKRGLERAVERGYHTGGRCFGYRSMAAHSKEKDGRVEGYRRRLASARKSHGHGRNGCAGKSLLCGLFLRNFGKRCKVGVPS